MNIKAFLLSCLVLFLVIVGLILVRYDGPYKGRVLDAETGKPLEGVV
jgi:hypothetical protein